MIEQLLEIQTHLVAGKHVQASRLINAIILEKIKTIDQPHEKTITAVSTPPKNDTPIQPKPNKMAGQKYRTHRPSDGQVILDVLDVEKIREAFDSEKKKGISYTKLAQEMGFSESANVPGISSNTSKKKLTKTTTEKAERMVARLGSQILYQAQDET